MHTLTALELREKFVTGHFSAHSIALHFLERIAQEDPKIGSFLAVFEERLLKKARALDAKRQRGESLGKLAGIPISLKDNIHVKGELTTCASQFLARYRAPFDATVTELLEAEDALLLGKTNLDEFAMGSATEYSAFKKTVNPRDPTCSPGGSSGGSAAALAARLCLISLGTDTGGSIRQPAAFCGVVGFKPTYGRVSRHGLVAYASSLDQIGPMAHNCRDAALVMEVIGKPCSRDSTSLSLPPDNYLAHLHSSLVGKRIGVPWQFLQKLSPEMRRHFDASLARFQQLGASLVDVDLSLLDYSIAVYYILATAEASTNLARFDGIRYGYRAPQAHTLEEVYTLSKEQGFGREVKKRILLGTFVLSKGQQEAYYHKAQQVRTLIMAQYRKAFTECDIIATPATPGPAFPLGSIRDPLKMYLEDLYTIGANLAGLPAIALPSGLTANGLPLSLMLTGPQKADVRVFQFAAAFETAGSPHA